MAEDRFEFASPATRSAREDTLIDIVETIEATRPETKAELSAHLDLSENYLSELLRHLKNRGLITKAYVVNERAVLEAAPAILNPTQSADRPTDHDHLARTETSITRLFERLEALDDVTKRQYDAANAAFDGTAPEETAADLEPLANERSRVVFEELKSMTIQKAWPGNRVAADLSTVATNFEIVGDRACFLVDSIDALDTPRSGVVYDRIAEIFDAGANVHDLSTEILFEADLQAIDTLYGVEDEIHRNLNELFELVTTYNPAQFGRLASLARTLEQTIYYWVHTAELAVRLHAGIVPEHISEL